MLPLSQSVQESPLHVHSPGEEQSGSGMLPQVSDKGGSDEVSHTTSPGSLDGSTEDDLTHIQQVKEDPGKALLLVLAELKEIKVQMINLSKMESTTASLVEQMASNTTKTNELESKLNNTEARANVLGEDLTSLGERVNQQESHVNELHSKVGQLGELISPIQTKVEYQGQQLAQQGQQLAELYSLKKDMKDSSEQIITRMNDLVDTQCNQVDTFNSGVKLLGKEWKEEVMADVEKRFQKMENLSYCLSLKEQAYRNRYNLVLVGLP